jgi:hypothetical protein
MTGSSHLFSTRRTPTTEGTNQKSTMAPPKSDAARRQWKPSFEWKPDYNDHFETPLVAYEDILPLLDGLKPKMRNRKDHVVYDPYYCNGRTAVLLHQLGFENVVHAKRDFYKDVEGNKVPQHDTLITNPPYSDQHKERCLEICLQQFRDHGRPFFLLMPNYVAARSYFRRILGDSIDDIAFLVPSIPYEYDHPEGTGHEISPFSSLWFCGVGNVQELKEHWNAHQWKLDRGRPTFATSINELEELSAIPTEKRPNPRQRKKRKAAAMASQKEETLQGKPQSANAAGRAQKSDSTKKVGKKAQKNSRHRDQSGKRTKTRF